MANTYPTGKVQIPISIRLQGNGKLATDQLAPVRGSGVMYKTAAVAFNFMWSQADKDGLDLNNWGTYLTYQAQVNRFLQRYSEVPTGRDPAITARWQGRIWWLKIGYAPCAPPGESAHGWGMAIDLNPAGERLEWLRIHAPLYGYKWEVGDPTSKYWEPWHLIYCYGSSYTLWVSNLIKQFFPNGK